MLAWWRHQMEAFSALLAFCAGNSPVTGEFPSQRPVTRNFDVFFDLRLSKQSWGWWLETPSRSLGRHCNGKGVPCVMGCKVSCTNKWGNVSRKSALEGTTAGNLRANYKVQMGGSESNQGTNLCGCKKGIWWVIMAVEQTWLYGYVSDWTLNVFVI